MYLLRHDGQYHTDTLILHRAETGMSDGRNRKHPCVVQCTNISCSQIWNEFAVVANVIGGSLAVHGVCGA